MVILTVAMLLISLAIITVNVVTAVTAPTMRFASSGLEPNLELPQDISFHCFLSHAWSTGQDQTHTLARQLQLLIPDLKIWLDVDKLNDVGALEKSVKESAVFIIFLSKGYFKSANCRRELYTALKECKPVVVVREADEAKGGADIEVFKEECRKECIETKPPAYEEYQGPTEVLDRLFPEEQDPVVWVRVKNFQMESLKVITCRMLAHLPHYQNGPELSPMGLRVPEEQEPVGFRTPMKLLVCSDNIGALSLAEEVRKASMEIPSAMPISILDAQSALHASCMLQTDNSAMLIYLNASTFKDKDGSVAVLLQEAMDLKLPLALVHEQDTSKGGCAFSLFFSQTPAVLLEKEYKLYDTVAVPMYPNPEHRRLSLRLVLGSIGATAIKARYSGWRGCVQWILAGGGEQDVVREREERLSLMPPHGNLEPTQAPMEEGPESQILQGLNKNYVAAPRHVRAKAGGRPLSARKVRPHNTPDTPGEGSSATGHRALHELDLHQLEQHARQQSEVADRNSTRAPPELQFTPDVREQKAASGVEPKTQIMRITNFLTKQRENRMRDTEAPSWLEKPSGGS